MPDNNPILKDRPGKGETKPDRRKSGDNRGEDVEQGSAGHFLLKEGDIFNGKSRKSSEAAAKSRSEENSPVVGRVARPPRKPPQDKSQGKRPGNIYHKGTIRKNGIELSVHRNHGNVTGYASEESACAGEYSVR